MLRVDPNDGAASFAQQRAVLLADELKLEFDPRSAQCQTTHADENLVEQQALVCEVDVGVFRDQAEALFKVGVHVRQHLLQGGVPRLGTLLFVRKEIASFIKNGTQTKKTKFICGGPAGLSNS